MKRLIRLLAPLSITAVVVVAGALWLPRSAPATVADESRVAATIAPTLSPTPVTVAATRPPAPPSSPPVAAKSAAPKPLAPREGWLVIPRIGLAAPVGSYDNCHQDAKHPTWDVPEGVTRWSCIQAGVWLLGHKPGIFTNLPLVQTGDRFYYGLQAYSVTGREEVAYGATVTVAPMTLQTCLRPDATVLLLVRAAPVP
jgi:hypothetical protein